MRINACSFTGHRKVEENHTELEARLMSLIEQVYDQGCSTFYVGGAVGFDTIVAQQLVLFRMRHKEITIHLVLPCRNQTQSWSYRQQDMYDYILSNADTVEYVADEYYKGCMRKRNARLVELCDCLIAYVGHEKSGAHQTLTMAERAGKIIFNVYKGE